MKIKSSQSVHFLETLTIEDEITLINHISDTKPKTLKNKAFGKCLQISNTKLLSPNFLEYADFFYAAENQNSFFLTMMLLSAPPFLNFLSNFKDKISDMQGYPILEKLINLMEDRNVSNIDKYISFEGCTDIKEGFSFLLKSIHQELVNNMHFEEDAWNIQKKGKAFKIIYSEYSPIVEIFQGKILEDVGEMKSGHFEIIKDVGILKTSNCKKQPFVFLQDCTAGVKEIESTLYMPVSLITNQDSLIILGEKKAFKYCLEGFSIIEDKKMIFDKMENIKFILYAKK